VIDAEEIKSRINLVDVVQQTVQLTRAGSEWAGRCPFHDDRSASLSVSDKLFHCHAAGCGKSGDIFTWIQERDRVDFQEALRRLASTPTFAPLPQPGNGKVKHDKAADKQKTLPMGIAEQYHKDLTAAHREYFHRRGIGDETIDHFKLGWDGQRYTIPVIAGGVLYNVRRRRDDTNRKDTESKFKNTPGYGAARVYNQDALAGAQTVVIAEGEFDAMVLIERGWTSVCSTAGAGTFKAEWAPLFDSCQTVYVCYDNDLAGRSGAAKVAALFGERARVVTLPEEVGDAGDITDFFTKLNKTDADFEALLAEATPYEAPPVADKEVAHPVHLAQSASSDLVGKKVEVKVLMAGKLDAPYIVPRKVRYTCWGTDRDRDACHANDDDRALGSWDRVFDDSDATFIELCHKRSEQLKRVLKAAAGCQSTCTKFSCEPVEYSNVEEVLAVPMAERVMAKDGSDIDETGNEYVARNLYLLDDKAQVNQYYKIEGRVYPHPQTQLGTILITSMNTMHDNISEFKLTDEVKELLRVFQPGVADLVEHVNRLLEDLANNVTRIYKRDEALLAVLLGYHSALSFEFEGRPIRRGWLEVLLLGDTGLGKTEIVRTIMDFAGLGVLCSGETTTRTGLTYTIEQVGERWFVKWGKYPLADRKLLAVDELSELPEDDLAKMTQGRNDGILRVDRAGVGETNCRTRLIWLSNPRFKKGLYNFSHGIEALKTLFPTPADLRRLDLAVFLANKDIDLDEINRTRRKPTEQVITAEALKASILWAWSRKVEDIVIDEDATDLILGEASRLSEIYGSAEDIPLVSPADMRNKLARMVVALAALLHSTDETHTKVIVLPVHVRFIGAYLDSIYQAKNCRYDVYAGYAAKSSRLDDVERADIKAELSAIDNTTLDGSGGTVSRDVLTLYRQHDTLTATEIADLLDIDRRTVAKRLKVLQRHGMISKTKYGYHKTPKFVEFLSSG
jgi:DNA-binding transcriptional ArsR family regulator/MoxR-like ATPase